MNKYSKIMLTFIGILMIGCTNDNAVDNAILNPPFDQVEEFEKCPGHFNTIYCAFSGNYSIVIANGTNISFGFDTNSDKCLYVSNESDRMYMYMYNNESVNNETKFIKVYLHDVNYTTYTYCAENITDPFLQNEVAKDDT